MLNFRHQVENLNEKLSNSKNYSKELKNRLRKANISCVEPENKDNALVMNFKNLDMNKLHEKLNKLSTENELLRSVN